MNTHNILIDKDFNNVKHFTLNVLTIYYIMKLINTGFNLSIVSILDIDKVFSFIVTIVASFFWISRAYEWYVNKEERKKNRQIERGNLELQRENLEIDNKIKKAALEKELEMSEKKEAM